MRSPEDIVTSALADLMNAVSEKQMNPNPGSGIEALSQVEQVAFDAAVNATFTFVLLRMGRVLHKETQ